MRVPIAWLRDYIDVGLTADELSQRLAMLGFPVEEIERRPKLSGIVAGRLETVGKHPNADRLSVCAVDVGEAAPIVIATAATNVAGGQIVPVARIGAKLVGLEIAPRTMRGIESQGMLVSAAEVGLESDWFEDGILQLERSVAPGTDLVAAYRLGDDVLDVEITANRVDAMSIVGIAREIGASLGMPVREPDTRVEHRAGEAVKIAPSIVELRDLDCRRFVAQRFSKIVVRTAPFWMRLRLALAGQRPINNLVDISNFVMLETGQPLHFYDFDRLAEGRLIVRSATPHEKMTTLDGEVRELNASDLVIADPDRVQCLAGLRGARESEVTTQTQELLLEAASFSGPRIRRMSIAHSLRTDASSRHEKGIPLALGEIGAARAAHLLQSEGAAASDPVAVGAPIERPPAISVTAAQVRALLGMVVADDEVELALRGLGFDVARQGEAFVATPPPWRSDLHIREDLIEEIGRIAGYDRIASDLPPVFEHSVSSELYRNETRLAHAMLAAGYREAVTLALQPAQPRERYVVTGTPLPGALVEIANPLSEDQRYMRFSLLPALLALVARFARDEPLRLFEIGHVFFEAFETAMVAWILAKPKADEPDWRDGGFLDFKSDSLGMLRALAGRAAEAVSAQAPELHPGKTASLIVDGKDVATIGAVDPRLLAAYEIDRAVYAGFARVHDLPAYRVPRYVASSRYPAVERDLAIVVSPQIPAMDIEHAVRLGAEGVVASVSVFDEYRGPQVEAGKKSIAVRVLLQRNDATLTDAEADRHVETILKSLEERCGARLRA